MRELQCSITLLDKIFIFIIGCFIIFIPVYFIINKSYSNSEFLWITTPNEEFVYSMDKPQNIEVKGHIGTTQIEIKDKKFRFINSECPNKQCIKSGWISFPMIPVVCLPNGVSAVIKKNKTKKSLEIDGVAM